MQGVDIKVTPTIPTVSVLLFRYIDPAALLYLDSLCLCMDSLYPLTAKDQAIAIGLAMP